MNLASPVLLWLLQILFISDSFQQTRRKILEQFESIDSQEYDSVTEFRNKTDVISHDKLLLTSSQIFPRQLTILNSSAQVGIVMNSLREKIAILNGHTGRGVVIDNTLKIGVVVEKGDWLIGEQDFKSYIRDCEVDAIMEKNSMNSFLVEEQDDNSEAIRIMKINLACFGDDFMSLLKKFYGKLIEGVLDIFATKIYLLRNSLGPVLNIAMDEWVAIKGGLVAILNVVTWMGDLVSLVAGGIIKLVIKSVKFPLLLIITADNGAHAFFYMLQELNYKFDLIVTLQGILSVPAQIAHFIAGLGGEIAEGITGVYNLVGKLFEYSETGLETKFQEFMDLLIQFSCARRPEYDEVQKSAAKLLTIADNQEARYNNDFGPYKEFLSSIQGTGEYKIGGVVVSDMIKALTQTIRSGSYLITGVLDTLKPLISLQDAIPYLLVSTVRSLSSNKRAAFIEYIIPSIKILEEPRKSDGNYFTSTTISPTKSNDSLVVARHRVVSTIYEEPDVVTQEYDNSTLHEMLENHSVAEELVEITTRALDIPVY